MHSEPADNLFLLKNKTKQIFKQDVQAQASVNVSEYISDILIKEPKVLWKMCENLQKA